jgi:hypothetical protein
VRPANLPCLPIHWSAKTHADSSRCAPGQQFRQRLFNLPPDALRCSFNFDRELSALHDFARLITDDKLELRSANLNPGKELHLVKE